MDKGLFYRPNYIKPQNVAKYNGWRFQREDNQWRFQLV